MSSRNTISNAENVHAHAIFWMLDELFPHSFAVSYSVSLRVFIGRIIFTTLQCHPKDACHEAELAQELIGLLLLFRSGIPGWPPSPKKLLSRTLTEYAAV